MFTNIQDTNKKVRNEMEVKKKAIILRKASMNPMAAAKLNEKDKQEQKYYNLTVKIDKLTKFMETQHEIIQDLRNEIRERFGLEKISTK